MRRALVLAALAAPIAVIAAISAAPSGQVVDLDNYNAAATTSYVNAAQCADSATAPLLNLQWSISRSTTVGSATYQLYASNVQSSKDDDPNFCPVQDDEAVTPNEFAKTVGSVAYSTDLQGLRVSGKAAVAAARKDCTRDGDIVFICAHLVDQTTSANIGFARGKFIVQVAAPGAVTITNVGSGDTRLRVDWTDAAGGVDVEHYEVRAYAPGRAPPAAPDATSTASASSTSATVGGLANGTEYTVYVVAFSLGGNPSPLSNAGLGTPTPSDGFWEVYRNTPGARETGGCGAGGAGPLALLAVAGLVASLRRRK